jgi:hypothetical protein
MMDIFLPVYYEFAHPIRLGKNINKRNMPHEAAAQSEPP